MKAVLCAIGETLDVYSPGTDTWRLCPCGKSAAKWEDASAGKLVVATRDHNRFLVKGLGLVNTVLQNYFKHGGMYEDFRQWHDEATNLEGYTFHRDRANCWAVPFLIGQTSDTRWATDVELREIMMESFNG